jgi:hypothetical protein
MLPIPPIEPDYRLEEAPEADIRGYAIEPEEPGDEPVFDPSQDFWDDRRRERTIQGENGEELEPLGGGTYRAVKTQVAVRSKPVKTIPVRKCLDVPPFRLQRLRAVGQEGVDLGPWWHQPMWSPVAVDVAEIARKLTDHLTSELRNRKARDVMPRPEPAPFGGRRAPAQRVKAWC